MSPVPRDGAAAPSLAARALVFLVRGYRLLLSPWLGSACRFTPTCSVYSIEALQTHGAMHGSYLTLRRLARCHPWCDGGHDPVPAKGRNGTPGSGALFSHLSSDKKSSP